MFPIDRRSLMQRALLLAGATLTPGLSMEALAQAAKETPRLLDARRFALLSAVADTMVPRTDTPGAVDAGVPKMLDGLLRNWASPSRRKELIGALDTVDRLAGPQGGFARLSPDKRHALLVPHDAAALKPTPSGEPAAPALKAAPTVVDPNYGRAKQAPPQGTAPESVAGEKEAGGVKKSGLAARMAGPAVADMGYAKLKELIVTLYYYSEPALTQELRYEHSPGEWVPSMPVTADTRPWGGAGFV